ncbi:unnamed protein product, partial [marine sediment metagenome]
MNKKILIGILVVGIVIVVGVWFSYKSSSFMSELPLSTKLDFSSIDCCDTENLERGLCVKEKKMTREQGRE